MMIMTVTYFTLLHLRLVLVQEENALVTYTDSHIRARAHVHTNTNTNPKTQGSENRVKPPWRWAVNRRNAITA